MIAYFFIKSVSTLFCLYLFFNPQVNSVTITVPRSIMSEKKSVVRTDTFDKTLHFFNKSRYVRAQKMQKYFRLVDLYDWRKALFCCRMDLYAKGSKGRPSNLEKIRIRSKVKVPLNRKKVPLNKVNKDACSEYSPEEKKAAMNESFSIVRSFLSTH